MHNSLLSNRELVDCKQKAIAYLCSQISRKGSWNCFETLAGTSDEWVTAYVGCCVASMDDYEGRKLAEKAHKFLSGRRFFSSGWGFNKIVPCDADSTAWGIRLYELLAEQRPLGRKYRHALKFLLKHVDTSGGVCTYKKEGPIRYFTRLKKNISFEGWCSAHPCVTAAVANLKDPQLYFTLDNLRNNQRSNGSWMGYWWMDEEYTTGLAAAALHRNDPTEKKLQSAIEWGFDKMSGKKFVSTSIFPEGSCFATAWMLHLLSFSKQWDRVGHIVEWLVNKQQSDGSWNASAALRIPPPYCTDPESFLPWSTHGKGGGSIIMDKNSVFTTATVIFALEHYTQNCFSE